MKNREERRGRWGEGWLAAAVLVLALVFFPVFYYLHMSRPETVAPVKDVSYEILHALEVVNLNTAPAERIAWLPGIGEELAGRIVAYREEHGGFSATEEIRNVPGIGEGKFALIRDRITIG